MMGAFALGVSRVQSKLYFLVALVALETSLIYFAQMRLDLICSAPFKVSCAANDVYNRHLAHLSL